MRLIPSSIRKRFWVDEGLNLTDSDGADVTIKAKSIFQPRKNLGHYKAPAGRVTTQFEKLKQKTIELLYNIVVTGGSKEDSRVLVDTVCTPAVTYTVGQSFMSDKQLDDIDKASMSRTYASCNYNRNTARRLLQAPIELGGGGFTPLKAYAYYGIIMNLIKHWRTPNEEIGRIL